MWFLFLFFCAVEKAVNELQHVLPDYTIVFTIAVLANDPLFTDVTNVQQLRIIERSLWLVLEPLVNNKDYFSFTFYKTMVERIKKTKNALKPDDDVLNTVSCAHLRIFRFINLTLGVFVVLVENVGHLRHCFASALHKDNQLRCSRFPP